MGDELSGNLTLFTQPRFYTGHDGLKTVITYDPEGAILVLFITGIVLLYIAMAWNLFESWRKRRKAKP